MDDIRMEYESSQSIVVRRPGNPDVEIHAVLVGNLRRNHLLVTGLRETTLLEGEPLTIEMVMGGRLVSGVTRVARVISDPVMIYALTYPVGMQVAGLRQWERLPLFQPFLLHTPKEVAQGNFSLTRNMMLNLSRGGCSFSSTYRADPASQYKLTFAIPGESRLHTMEAEVLSSVHVGNMHRQRVQFERNNENFPFMEMIGRWIAGVSQFAIDSHASQLATASPN